MSRVVWKYELGVPSFLPGVLDIMLPRGAEILHVGLQRDNPTVWALVDPLEPPTERRELVLMGTGHEYEGTEALNHLGTLLMDGDALVMHVFETFEAAHNHQQ